MDGKEHRVYVLLGDAELQEGSVWEAIMAAASFQLTNLIAIVDRNTQGVDGPTEELIPLEPLGDRWRTFGWEPREIDAHSLPEILDGLAWAKEAKESPRVLICGTRGGRVMEENNPAWRMPGRHRGSSWLPKSRKPQASPVTNRGMWLSCRSRYEGV